MPSFDIVSEIDKQELDNAINQARKERENYAHCRRCRSPPRPARNYDRQTFEAQRRSPKRRAGRSGNLIHRSCPAGIKNSAGTRRKQSQGNHSGDQVAGFQGAKPVARSTNSRHREKERRLASRYSIREEPRLRRRHQFQEFQRLILWPRRQASKHADAALQGDGYSYPPCTGGIMEISSPGSILQLRSTNSTPTPIKMLLSCARSAGC